MKARIQNNNLVDLFDRFNNMLPMGDAAEKFFGIIMLPDEKFDAMYEEAKKDFLRMFESQGFQEEMLKAISSIPSDSLDISNEDSEFTQLINDIKEEEGLSENKKDMLITTLNKWIGTIINLAKVPRIRINVSIEKLNENARIPEYAHATDAGADVFAAEDITLKPRETQIIKTGIRVAIPTGYEIQIRPRSGLSFKTGLRIANAPGTIDSDYRGEIGIIMTNFGTTDETIRIGDKIAQMIIAPVPMINFIEEKITDETERGEGGFGSTDNKS